MSTTETKINMHANWLPFTPNHHFKGEHPRVIVAAKGMHFTTDQGKQVLDGASSLWCTAAGHGQQSIADAIYKQLNTLDYSPAFQFGNTVAFQAAEKIASMAPGHLNRVFF